MKNIIKIIEKNNKLELGGKCPAVVCGNSNYYIQFSFSDEWQECSSKTAIFYVKGKKILVDFEGDQVQMPALSNTQSVKIAVMSAKNSDFSLSSSCVRILALPTPVLEEMPELDPLKNYLQTIIGAINSIQNGEVVAKNAVYAENAESSSTAGVAENVSNPNLLINGDFKVNQRGGLTYSTAGAYTVDRWKLVSGSLVVEDSGITLNGSITQTLENLPTMDVVASVDTSGGDVTATYSNGVFTITTTNETLITWAKLEVGTTATVFSPKTYAEELANCQRYYERISSSNNSYTNYGYGFVQNVSSQTVWLFINYTEKRIKPTITSSGTFSFRVASANVISSNSWADITTRSSKNIAVLTDAISYSVGVFGTFRSEADSTAYIEIDAEIY